MGRDGKCGVDLSKLLSQLLVVGMTQMMFLWEAVFSSLAQEPSMHSQSACPAHNRCGKHSDRKNSIGGLAAPIVPVLFVH
jgi:hypothetical protein